MLALKRESRSHLFVNVVEVRANVRSLDEQNGQFRDLIRGKIDEYLGRTEALRTHLSNAERKGAVNSDNEPISNK